MNLSKDCSKELADNKDIQQLITDKITEVNAMLNPEERIKSASLSPEEFSCAGGHLTASQKLKRDWLAEHYSHLINSPQIKIF